MQHVSHADCGSKLICQQQGLELKTREDRPAHRMHGAPSRNGCALVFGPDTAVDSISMRSGFDNGNANEPEHLRLIPRFDHDLIGW